MNNNKNLNEADISAIGALFPVAAVGLAAGGYLAAKGIGSFKNFLASRAKRKADATAAAAPAPIAPPTPVPIDDTEETARKSAKRAAKTEKKAARREREQAEAGESKKTFQGILSTYGDIGRAVGASKAAAAAAAAARQAELDQAANERQVNKTEAETLRAQALILKQKNERSALLIQANATRNKKKKDDAESAATISLRDAQTKLALSKIPKPTPTAAPVAPTVAPDPVPVFDSVPDEIASPAAGAVKGIVDTIKKRKLDPEWQIKNTKPIFSSKSSLFTKKQIKNTSKSPLEGSFGKPEVKQEVKQEVEPKAKPKVESKAKPKGESKAKPKVESKAKPKGESKVEPKTSTPTSAPIPVVDEDDKRNNAIFKNQARMTAARIADKEASEKRKAARIALSKPASTTPANKAKHKEPDGLTPEQLKIAQDIKRENFKKKEEENTTFNELTDSTHYYVTSILKNLLG